MLKDLSIKWLTQLVNFICRVCNFLVFLQEIVKIAKNLFSWNLLFWKARMFSKKQLHLLQEKIKELASTARVDICIRYFCLYICQHNCITRYVLLPDVLHSAKLALKIACISVRFWQKNTLQNCTVSNFSQERCLCCFQNISFPSRIWILKKRCTQSKVYWAIVFLNPCYAHLNSFLRNLPLSKVFLLSLLLAVNVGEGQWFGTNSKS